MGGRRGYRRLVNIDNANTSASIFTATQAGLRDFFPLSEAGSSDRRGGGGDYLLSTRLALPQMIKTTYESYLPTQEPGNISPGSSTFSSDGKLQISLRMVFIISRRALGSREWLLPRYFIPLVRAWIRFDGKLYYRGEGLKSFAGDTYA